MQKTNHSTRAYFVSSNKLEGFLVAGTVLQVLKSGEENGEFDEVKKQQHINMKGLIMYFEVGCPFSEVRGGSSSMVEEHNEFLGSE